MKSVTIFCAIWHKDPKRRDLIVRHRENLRRQSIPVEVIYVFDGDDIPPLSLDALTIRASEMLSIYQAWNLALAAVRTPLVMNFNLDDRLAPDAAEKLVEGLERTGAMLIGGDWRICYSQEETEAVTSCVPAQVLPLTGTWPPSNGVAARLGSSVDCMTYGPSTLWRMAAHKIIPRYPWRFFNGKVIEAISDGIFWEFLKRKNCRLERLPLIVGNYHSHPHEQAEFRHDKAEEWQIASSIGVPLN